MQAAFALALAHSGRRDEAMKKAEDLFKSNSDRTPILLPLARCFAVCAAPANDDEGRRREHSRYTMHSSARSMAATAIPPRSAPSPTSRRFFPSPISSHYSIASTQSSSPSTTLCQALITALRRARILLLAGDGHPTRLRGSYSMTSRSHCRCGLARPIGSTTRSRNPTETEPGLLRPQNHRLASRPYHHWT